MILSAPTYKRTVTKTLKIVWDNEYARVADLKIYYFDPLTEYVDETEEDAEGGLSNEVQFWKNCYTNPISEETYPFADQGEKESSFDDCGLRCIQEYFQM